VAESGLLENWPKGPDGEPERAVLLENAGDFAAFGGLICSMLESFGIPYLTRRTGQGQIGFLYGGFSPEGIRIYVPASRLEEARELLAAENGEEELL
jgi:hypothetical protein